ncbi:MAG: 2-phospho-L-lactate guanylyltransferase [Alphaproteobacteria bacterium]|nr:2-phospho-L-lactate guanylyltransferase [Alphaproteobacteria bacterium]
MSVVAVIPIKPFAEGKSRLASVLTNDQRRTLNRNMFCHVLKTAFATQEIDEILVISSDEEALTLAEQAGAHAILEAENSNLNAALDIGRKASLALGAASLLVIPADLAQLAPSDLSALLTASDQSPSAAIFVASDQSQKGTNALYMRPIDAIPFSFGPDSFEKHQGAAKDAGCNVSVIVRPNLAFDIDEPEDLRGLDENYWRA